MAGNGCPYPRNSMEYADTAPRLGRGRDRSGTSEASTADSPTATAGSRAAQRKKMTVLYEVKMGVNREMRYSFKNANTISGVKSTLMMVQRPCPMSLADAPSSHTSSSIIR